MAEKAETKVEYEVDYRDIKYPRLEYKTGSLLLILPKDYERETTLLEKHKNWITKKQLTISVALEEAKGKRLDLQRTKKKLEDLVLSFARKYEESFGFRINRIYFRKMKTKWGSYSSKGNLTINTLLKHLPEELIKYVVFHETAHSQERKHNERFWRIINKEFEDWQTREKDLLVYWFLVQTIYSKDSNIISNKGGFSK